MFFLHASGPHAQQRTGKTGIHVSTPRKKPEMSKALSSSLLPSEPLPWRPNTRPRPVPGALLDIDQGPLWDILTVWLPFKSLCHLDSAICNRKRRLEFLAMVGNRVLLFNRVETATTHARDEEEEYDEYGEEVLHSNNSLSLAALCWVVKRGLHLASLRLPSSLSSLFGRGGQRTREQRGDRETVAVLARDGRLDKLESLCLARVDYIRTEDLVGILSSCGATAVIIMDLNCLGPESPAVLVKRCTKLEAYTASGYESVQDMVEIVQSCRKLRKLRLGALFLKLTDAVLECVAENCPRLEHFSVPSCHDLTDAAIRGLTDSCVFLQSVDFSRLDITDATVVALIANCPHLRRLFFRDCKKPTDAAVLAVAEGLTGLTHVALGRHLHSWVGPQVSGASVEALARSAHRLEFVDFRICLVVTDTTRAVLSENCPSLREARLDVTVLLPSPATRPR